jgi:hypothetical protein
MRLRTFSLQAIDPLRFTSNCFIRSDLDGAIVPRSENLRKDGEGCVYQVVTHRASILELATGWYPLPLSRAKY